MYTYAHTYTHTCIYIHIHIHDWPPRPGDIRPCRRCMLLGTSRVCPTRGAHRAWASGGQRNSHWSPCSGSLSFPLSICIPICYFTLFLLFSCLSFLYFRYPYTFTVVCTVLYMYISTNLLTIKFIHNKFLFLSLSKHWLFQNIFKNFHGSYHLPQRSIFRWNSVQMYSIILELFTSIKLKNTLLKSHTTVLCETPYIIYNKWKLSISETITIENVGNVVAILTVVFFIFISCGFSLNRLLPMKATLCVRGLSVFKCFTKSKISSIVPDNEIRANRDRRAPRSKSHKFLLAHLPGRGFYQCPRSA